MNKYKIFYNEYLQEYAVKQRFCFFWIWCKGGYTYSMLSFNSRKEAEDYIFRMTDIESRYYWKEI